MKQFILVLTIFILTTAETVKPTDACSCEKILSEADCKAITNCAWTVPVQGTTVAAGSCGTTTTPTTTTEPTNYCLSVSEPEKNCWKTLGCAYVDGKCTFFTGCSAYVRTTNSHCQAISKLCVTDGTYCTNAKACNEYPTETECTTNASTSGSLNCKWDNNVCRDHICSEADITLVTDDACNAWLPGCLTTGKGCTTTSGVCASYIGDNMTCVGLKGTDGNCEGTAGGSSCTPRICSKADPTLYKTDFECKQYKDDCIANGKGCVSSPLPACESYSGDYNTCKGYIGSDGICEGDIGGTLCRSRVCSNAPTTLNTDLLCDAYRVGCVTVGQGCSTQRGPCSSYYGTTTSCNGHLGTDGYCQGTNASILSPCQVKVCTGAPSTASNDKACELYQQGCRSTGLGCTDTLGPCSSYSGTCEGYIGTDGYCKGNSDNNGPCTPKICNEAPQSTSTNEACAQYQTGCVTTGAGCVALTQCQDTIKSITCEGSSGCGWNNICVPSLNCSDFTTASICKGNFATNILGNSTITIPCYWTGTLCKNRVCTDAPTTLITDSLCETFLIGCRTNGKGCLDLSAPCSSYFGDRNVCSKGFAKKCWNTESASITAPCTERFCTDDITSTTDTACNSFKTGCRTKGTGCIDPSKLCSDYNGIQSVCDTFKGNHGQIRCWALSNTVSSVCIDKTCRQLASASSDLECFTFLGECLYGGVGCVPKSTPCSGFIGTQTECGKFKGSNGAKICWSISIQSGNCIEKTCNHAPIGRYTDQDCNQFLQGCLSTGSSCVPPSTPCSNYIGTISECSTFTGNSLKCYNKDQCTDKACSDISNPTTDDDCKKYLSTCRYFNSNCVNVGQCSTYAGTSLTLCQDVLDANNNKCWWASGSFCISRSCDNAPSTVNSQSGCDGHFPGCMYTGANSCVLKGNCNGYMAHGTQVADKSTNCQTMIDTNGKNCFYISGDNCITRDCSNVPGIITGQSSCDAHISGCTYNGYTCTITDNCVNYVVSGTDTEKLTICLKMIDKNSNLCWWISGGNCSDRSCSTVNSLLTSNQSTCETHINNSCIYSGSCNEYVCSSKTDARSQQDCSDHQRDCRYVGGPVCVTIQDSCSNYVLDPSITDLQTKYTMCQLLRDQSEKQYCTYGGTGQTCKPRSCSDVIRLRDFEMCIMWLNTCQWMGGYHINLQEPGKEFMPDIAGRVEICVDAQSDCSLYTLNQDLDVFGEHQVIDVTQICERLMPLQNGHFCTAGIGQTCKNRICADVANPTSLSDCSYQIAPNSFCEYIGSGSQCVDAKSDCNLYTVIPGIGEDAATICQSLTDSSYRKCWYESGLNCRTAVCSDIQNASSYGCYSQLTNCKWDGGSKCMEARSDCAYTVDINQDPVTFCSQLHDTSSPPKQCQFDSGQKCKTRVCSEIIINSFYHILDCQQSQCIRLNETCSDPKNDCSEYIFMDDFSAEQICQSLFDSQGRSCQISTKRQCKIRTDCNSQTSACEIWLPNCRFAELKSPFCVEAKSDCSYNVPTNLDPYSYCETITDSSSPPKPCQFDQVSSKCSTRVCSGKKNATNHDVCNTWLKGCQWTGRTTGITCTEPNTCFNCKSKSCFNIKTIPTSNKDCINWSTTCRFNGSNCVPQGGCNTYSIILGTDQQKRSICEGITNDQGQLCAFTNGESKCTERTCLNVSIVTETNCISWLGSACKWDGTQCLTAGACNFYTAIGNTDEAKKIYCNTLSCGWTTGINCTVRDCTNVYPTPTSDQDCQTYQSYCTLANTSPLSCIPTSSSCSQQIGTAAQCKKLRGLNGSTLCWSMASDTAPPTFCIVKQCSLNTTARTNDECNSFLSGCKTNGLGCVVWSTPCSAFEGNASTCALRLNATHTDSCKAVTSVSDNCTIKSCYDDGSSTTDHDCQIFMSTCLTQGIGCIPNTEPCSSYRGTQETCSKFMGNFKKCWNTITATKFHQCVNKKCSDDDTSVTDIACQYFLNGCVTKGVGCIEDSAECSAYSGIQATCDQFKGNKASSCWNAPEAIATNPCIERKCNHNTQSTTDADCELFLPRTISATIPKCVTSGAGCVDYPRSCSQFTGTNEQCGKFTATDGPCKTTATGSISATGICTPRICSEALNSYNTDALCKTYHPTCVTTGYGCALSVICSMIQEQNSCSAKIGCSWVSNCRSIETDCKVFTTASICVNTPVSTGTKKCSWDNNSCRAQTCNDLPATIISHEACKAIIPTCTTTGSGCITMTVCSAYINEIICKTAKTTDIGNTCIWDTQLNTCRVKICTDARSGITTNSGCQSYLAGCKTNGISCVASVTCSTLLTAAACLVDEQNNPCLFINKQCQSYSQCQDVIMTTHQDCQYFSPSCTSDGVKCIAITTCAKTKTIVGCLIGTDGICGWLPANGVNPASCQKFGSCSDAIGTNIAQCIAYGSNCISDGTKCIEKSTCSSYLTQIACQNSGTDGKCQFISNSCRLRECIDATASEVSGGITSHSGCYGFIAKTQCTTNGTSCIDLQACSTYTIEARCVQGTDGICVYDYPVGQTTGTIACRVKTCGDFKFTNSIQCSTAFTGCVSDGTNCIVKTTCSSYTSKEACNGGGTDGLCAFNSTITPTVGTCKLMTSCTDANNDPVACYAKSQVCNWQTGTTTACNAHTCATIASGLTCSPVPSFDLKTYTICGPDVSGCTEVAGNTLLASTCQLYTMKTFTWDETNSKCTSCFTTTTTDPGTGGTTVTQATTDGNIIKSLATLGSLAIIFA